jgi:tetratricopeptide (TPR) repeat protein
VHTWGARSYHSQVNLNRLSNRESLAMVSYLLGTENLDKDLEELILEKTEGIPFFVEEFIKSLKDIKVIEKKDNRYHLIKEIQDVTIPSTIQDVIMARVDSLSGGAKEVLQTGSVIEREFSYELIKRVMSLSEQELLSHLSALKDSELLYERGIYPESSYIFKHALTQEVVYDSILAKRKKKLHEEIGNAIEEAYKDSIDEHYGVLAEHFREGENFEKGSEYLRLAAKKAQKTASFMDAIEYAQKRVASLERLPRTDDVEKKIIDARTVLGLYYNQIAYHVEAREAVDPVIELATKHGYKKRLPQIYTITGAYYYFVEENLPKAFEQLEEVLKISEEINDVVSLFLATYWLGNVASGNCEFEKAFYYFEKALNLNVAANTLWGISLSKNTISFNVYNLQGRVKLGYQTSEEALRIAEESGDILSKAGAYSMHGVSCLLKGFFEEAEKHLLKGIGFSERIDHFLYKAIAQSFLAETYFEIGNYQKAQDHYDKASRTLEHARLLPSWMNLHKIGVAKAKVMKNEKDIDLEPFYEYEASNRLKQYDGWMRRYISEILLNIDDQHMPEAEEWINKAIETDKRNGMMWYLGRDYALYAELFKRKGEQSNAKENLTKAIEIYKECGADGWQEKAEKELAGLS